MVPPVLAGQLCVVLPQLYMVSEGAREIGRNGSPSKLATKADNPDLIPSIYMGKERADSQKLSSDLTVWAPNHAHIHASTHARRSTNVIFFLKRRCWNIYKVECRPKSIT